MVCAPVAMHAEAADDPIDALGPRFDAAVPDGGYAWWYVDAISDDGQEALTIIAFVGSVFSPHYFRARARARARLGARGSADPRAHCGLNVALYRREGRSWVFTEARGDSVRAGARSFAIGDNRIAWEEGRLVARIDDRTVPWRRRVRGVVTLIPAAPPQANHWSAVALDGAAAHRWLAIAPRARVVADFDRPAWRFAGSGYHDANWGDVPLEDGFVRWNWCRADAAGTTRVVYDLEERGEVVRQRAWAFEPGQTRREIVALAAQARPLPASDWKISRDVRGDRDSEPTLVRTLEDGPFYARSLLSTTLEGHTGLAVHESLDLERFARPSTQLLLPFKVWRRG